MKVFSKKNEKFEKPLFFFQIVLTGGQESSRIEDLKETYGTYNYRIYRINEHESQLLLFDILGQHRRISQNLDVVHLIRFLLDSKWIDFDLTSLTNHIDSLEFEKESGLLLSSYVLLASKYVELIPIASECIRKIHLDFYSNLNKVNYNTYFGNNWCFPIHIGIIYASTSDLYIKDKAIKQLKYWQEKNSDLTMIGPHFGLSRDYDEFLIWGAGGLFGLLASLFKDSNDMRFYFASQLRIIIDNTSPKFKIPNVIWLLHIIPPIEKSKRLFNYAIKAFKEVGCFSMVSFWNPPFLNQDDDFIDVFHKQSEKLFGFQDYIRLIESKPKFDNVMGIKTACMILTENNLDDDISSQIIETI